MRFNKWTIGLSFCAALLFANAARAQLVTLTTTNAGGGTTSVTLPVDQVKAALGLPAGVSMPAFDSGGLDFTNVNYKVGTGYEYLSGGGSAAYIEGDADLYKTSFADFGVAGNVTLSSSTSGFQSAALDFELLKNFSNFQIAGQAGIGGRFQGSGGLYGEENLEINYNLTRGTGLAFLGSQSVFTYVFGKVSLQESAGTTGGGKLQFDKEFETGAGVSF